MYRVTGIRLENICQYDAWDAELPSGLSAVVGPNGSGKTTLLRALAYGLTGLVDGGWGTQKSLQRDGTATPGFVEVRLTDGTDELSVRRYSTSDAKFADAVSRNGRIEVQRRKAVDAFMADVFGMSPALFFQVCWGRQGQLAQLLTAPPAMVGAFLSQVWDTRALEKLREKLKVQIDTIATLSPMCREQLARDESELAALPQEQEVDAALTDARRALAEASVRLERLKESLRGACDPFRKQALVASRGADVLELERALEGMSATRPEAEYAGMTAAQAHAEYAKLHDQRSRAETKLACLKAERRSAAERVQRYTEALAQLLEEHGLVTARLREADEAVKCAVCGGNIADHAAYRNHLCKTLTTYATEQLYEEDCRKRHDGAMDALDAAKAEVGELDGRLEAAQGSLDALQGQLEAALAAYNDLAYYEKLHKLEKARESLAETEAMPVMDDASRAELEKAEAAVREAGDVRDAALGLKQQAAASRRLLSSAVETDRAAVAQQETNANAREALEQLRDVLSRGRAQQRYMRSRVEALNRALSRFMALTGMPFSLRLDADAMAFVFVTADGYEHPACHLSGAQQSMSALALQMALFEAMRPNLNLYLIDEPAEALDDENKLVMADMFARMNRMLPSVDGTMLIVTRDRPIVEACENVVDVTQGR